MIADRISAMGLAISCSTLLLNLMTLRSPRGEIGNDAPRVSILVPARNEASTILNCIGTLLAQRYPNYEIIVLNDHSEDGTAEILAELMEKHEQKESPRLRVLQGAPLPPGWTGKNWACHQLAQTADPSSHFLLFTDADTVHQPHALAAAVSEAHNAQLVMLSLFPRQKVQTLWEQLMVPLLNHQILAYLPLIAMERTPFSALAAANGQYLLIQNDSYRSIGGHAAIAGEIAEDVLLARRLKSRGRVRLADGAALVQCRMYTNRADIMNGYRRSFASAFRIEPTVTWALVALNFAAYTLPFLRAPFSALARRMVSSIILLYSLLALRSHSPVTSIIGLPLGMGCLIFAQLCAARDARVGTSAAWKGRSYSLHDE